MFKLHIPPSSRQRCQSHADSFGFILLGVFSYENFSLHFGLCGTTRMIFVKKKCAWKVQFPWFIGFSGRKLIFFLLLICFNHHIQYISCMLVFVSAICFTPASCTPYCGVPRSVHPPVCLDRTEHVLWCKWGLHATTPLFNWTFWSVANSSN